MGCCLTIFLSLPHPLTYAHVREFSWSLPWFPILPSQSLMCDFKCPGPLMMMILIGKIQAIYTGEMNLLRECKCCFSTSLLLHFVILTLLFTCFNAVFLSSLITCVSAKSTLDLFSAIYPYLTWCLEYGWQMLSQPTLGETNK